MCNLTERYIEIDGEIKRAYKFDPRDREWIIANKGGNDEFLRDAEKRADTIAWLPWGYKEWPPEYQSPHTQYHKTPRRPLIRRILGPIDEAVSVGIIAVVVVGVKATNAYLTIRDKVEQACTKKNE